MILLKKARSSAVDVIKSGRAPTQKNKEGKESEEEVGPRRSKSKTLPKREMKDAIVV